jgi:hypothetical protein
MLKIIVRERVMDKEKENRSNSKSTLSILK